MTKDRLISLVVFFGLPALVTYIQLIVFSFIQAAISPLFGIAQYVVSLFHEPLFTFPITMVLYIFNLVWFTSRIIHKPPPQDIGYP